MKKVYEFELNTSSMKPLHAVLMAVLLSSFALGYTETNYYPSELVCREGFARTVTVDGYFDGQLCGEGYACPGGVEFEGGLNRPAGAVFVAETFYDGTRYFDGGSGLIQAVPSGIVISHPVREHSNVFIPWYLEPARFEDDDHMYRVTYEECVGQPPIEVPEFSPILMGAGALAAIGIALYKRR